MKKICPTKIPGKSCWINFGFTLVELLITLSIIGLLAAFGLARYQAFNRGQVLLQTGQTVKVNLRLARDKALNGEKKATCTNFLEGYEVQFGGSCTQDYCFRAKCDVVSGAWQEFEPFPDGISLLAPPSPNPILFKVLGHGSNVVDTTQILLQQLTTGATATVQVNQAGEIR